VFRTLLAIIALSLCLSSAPAHARRSARSSATHGAAPYKKVHRSGDQKLTALWKAELKYAKRKRKQVIVMFSADWCAPCKAIKQFLHDSSVVRKALRRGHFLIIDVDEWRGPAHRLIPGINPTKLPTIVRVDHDGNQKVKCFGSELGLLHEDAIATNLKRLIAGKAPGKPFYRGNAKLESEFIRKQSAAQDALTKGVPEVEVKVRSAASGIWTLNIVLRNHDGPRRWYLLPNAVGGKLSEHPKVKTFDEVKWDEHVRATFRRFHGKPGFIAIPVAGYGSVTLNRWTMYGDPSAKTLTVWKLNRLVVDGETAQFQKKLPYVLKLERSSKHKVQARGAGGKVEIGVAKRFAAPLRR